MDRIFFFSIKLEDSKLVLKNKINATINMISDFSSVGKSDTT